VLSGYTLHGNDKVLQTALFLLFLGRLAVHNTIERGGILQEIVDTGHDTENSEREHVDTNNGNNAKELVRSF
jgi:hypothetical protein